MRQKTYKIQMQGLSCKFCTRPSQEFTILKCDHVACGQCLWSQMKASYNGGNSVRCPCGQVSNFINKSHVSSSSATAHITRHGSPRRYASVSRPIRTEMSELLKTHKEEQTQSQIPYRMRRKSTEVSTRSTDLSRQLQFLSIQFDKAIEEIEYNFRIVVKTIHQKYQNLVKNIRLFWLQEIVQSQPLHYLNLPKLFEKKYQKSIGHSLKHFNDMLIQNFMNFKANSGGPYQRLTIPADLRDNKENHARIQNCRIERQKLLRTIQHLKDDRGAGLKKVGKKVPKYKFL